jgi:hypothetical protein
VNKFDRAHLHPMFRELQGSTLSSAMGCFGSHHARVSLSTVGKSHGYRPVQVGITRRKERVTMSRSKSGMLLYLKVGMRSMCE